MLSVVIPCYNEEQTIARSVDKLSDFLKEPFEIILVIEKSADHTLDVARHLERVNPRVRVLENDRRYGKGYTVRTGVLASQGEEVLVTDADLPVEIERYFPVMQQLLRFPETGAVYATAISDKCDASKRGLMRAAATFILFVLRRFVLKQDVSDSQLGFKLYRGDVVRQALNTVEEPGFLYDVMLTDAIVRLGYRVEECAVRIEGFAAKSSVSFREMAKCALSFTRYTVVGRKKLCKRIVAYSKERTIFQRPAAVRIKTLLLAITLLAAVTGTLIVAGKVTALADNGYRAYVQREVDDGPKPRENVVGVYGYKKSHPHKPPGPPIVPRSFAK